VLGRTFITISRTHILNTFQEMDIDLSASGCITSSFQSLLTSQDIGSSESKLCEISSSHGCEYESKLARSWETHWSFSHVVITCMDSVSYVTDQCFVYLPSSSSVEIIADAI
jgi:hypothetical protein